MYYRQIAILTLINCLLALGTYLPLSTGLMVVCFGSVMSIGAVAGAAAHSTYAIPLPLAVILGGLAAALCSLAIGLLCIRLRGFIFAVATLGVGELARVIAINSEFLGGALGFRNVRVQPMLSYSVITFALIAILFYAFEKSPARKTFEVIRHNETLAESLGIDTEKYRLLSLLVGGFLAGIGGTLYIHGVGILDPRMFGFENSLQILIFAIFGGVASFKGPIAGAVLLTIVPEIFRFSTPLRMILYGVCVIIIVTLRPEGILAPLRRHAPTRTSQNSLLRRA